LKKNLRRLVLLALALSLNAFGEPAKVDIVRTDWYKITIDGEIQGENYATYHTATEAALNAWLACDYCQVMILQPAISIDGTKAIVPVPVPVPIDPVVIVPEPDPVDPEPDPVPEAIYSYALDAEGALIAPLPLDGASLLPQVIYVQWRGGTFKGAKTWCCKLPGAEHEHTIEGLQFSLDLATLPASTDSYEMYTDVYLSGGRYLSGNYAMFTVIPAEVEIIDLTLSWTPPTERENGDALQVEELQGYTLAYRVCNSSAWVQHFVAGGTINDFGFSLPKERYDFRVNAVDTGDLVSQWSAIVSI
jgi:hypothetical protein